MNLKSWINIFDECNLVDYDADNYYLIRWSIHNNCVILKNGVSIVDNTQPILEKYNIFEAKKIGVDIDSFREEINRSTEHIRQIIVEQYQISYIYKIIMEKKLRYKDLDKYLKKYGCSLINEEEVFEKCYLFTIRDNCGNYWRIDARFDEREYDDYEPYWSKLKIIEKIKN